MDGNEPRRAVLDTNIIVSAIAYGGKPGQILSLVYKGQVLGIVSPAILNELERILVNKIGYPSLRARLYVQKVRNSFTLVYPAEDVNVLRDEPDNRILETAQAGDAKTIITGDKELLGLAFYKGIVITTARKFLAEFSERPYNKR